MNKKNQSDDQLKCKFKFTYLYVIERCLPTNSHIIRSRHTRLSLLNVINGQPDVAHKRTHQRQNKCANELINTIISLN